MSDVLRREDDLAFRLFAAGAVGLLCELSVLVRDPEEKEALVRCVEDWCVLTGWTMRVTLQRVDVFPPDGEDAE